MWPNRKSPYADPRLMRSLANHFSRIGIRYTPTTTRTGSGAAVVTYQRDQQLAPINIYKEPIASAVGQEVRRPDQTIVTNGFKLALNGYYPMIVVADVIRIDETNYNVITVEHDDSRTFTMLTVEVVNGISIEL